MDNQLCSLLYGNDHSLRPRIQTSFRHLSYCLALTDLLATQPLTLGQDQVFTGCWHRQLLLEPHLGHLTGAGWYNLAVPALSEQMLTLNSYDLLT